MKSPTTFLVDRAMAKHQSDPSYDASAGLAVHRESAQSQLSEPVIDACLFSRPWSYGADKAAQQFGLLGQLALRKSRELRAGGLPKHFLLAVTAEHVVALERTITTRSGPTGIPGGEVARWRRADLTVTWELAGYLYNATIESPAEQEKVSCCVVKAPISESFLRLLADPSATAPAVA